MVLATDTLRFLPGDSASTTLTVIVSDMDGNVMEGQRVNVSLGDPSLGYIESLDTDLRDTTNAQGRVDLLFTAIGTAGDMIFTATAGNIITWDSLAIRQEPIIGTLRLTMTPRLLTVSIGDTVAAQICIFVSDIQGNSMTGINFLLGPCGEPLDSLPPTDDSGRACGDYEIVVLGNTLCFDIGLGDLIRSFIFFINIADSSQTE